ncbi:N-acetylmuramoyl-L-alanine amidase [Sinanaerobacter chloroacetimidivorans]|uniref:N-acetylmuramoyl-L-alanine amidase n=1 Tax=Sinanaerobacter chloroacetimidivorans TaxID=2818044 RepID=A0A8J7W5K6_9FIRM|nr:N-acetylmuramoyl-L-alanine amidase [Sinanaerobacter chloroacetimidivorans]MBR0599625.1 N-acetylmuramoyl-L-alanine amidase [Sinanaerobacter chloroacetimidivorans]
MPNIYLDPSVEENEYVGGGNEEYYMNLIVDAMIPYLNIAGIGFVRNNPDNTLNQIIDQSNAGNYDLHLSLRSTPALQIQQGPIVYYDAYRTEAQSAAYKITRNLWSIYPDPNLVNMVPNSTLSQIALTNAPTVLIDLVNPRNYEDTEWLRNNIYKVARNLVFGLTDYFQIPFNVRRDPIESRPENVNVQG